MGTYYQDSKILTLFAEPLRSRITDSLKSQGFEVRQIQEGCGDREYFNGIVSRFGDCKYRVDLVADLNPNNPSLWTAGWFDESTGRLDIRYENFGPGIASLLRRHGFKVGEVLEDQNLLVFYGYKGRTESTIEWTLQEELAALRRITGEHASAGRGAHKKRPNHRKLRPEVAKLLPLGFSKMVEQHLRSYSNTGSGGRCLLCVGPASGQEPNPDLCKGCNCDIESGIFFDFGLDHEWEQVALWAIRELTMQFGGPPSQRQLAVAVGGTGAMRAFNLLLRLLVPVHGGWAQSGMSTLNARKIRSWSEWLSVAGVLDGGWRPSRGVISTATDGHLCHSLLERHIDDFMHKNSISHEREPAYPFDPVLNMHGLRADWRLADGTFVEATGLLGDAAYEVKLGSKRLLALQSKTRLIEVHQGDLGSLELAFHDWLNVNPDQPRGS